MTNPVLVTGANGFVGRALCSALIACEIPVRAVARRPSAMSSDDFDTVVAPGVLDTGLRADAFADVDVVVHTAARVHVMRETSSDPLSAFRRVNVDGTLRLARQAAEAGVRRFVFISSIKVNGEATEVGNPFTADDVPKPVDPYGISKLEAEQGLKQLASESGIEVSIIRPVLVYGPGVAGNFISMLRWIASGVPLPLGDIDNRRSLVGIDNLVNLIIRCTRHPQAANQIFLVSDGLDLSTTDLLRRCAVALGKRPRLIPVPARMLHMAAVALGKGGLATRLLGSLQADISKTRDMLGWTPPVDVDEALRRAASVLRRA